MDYRRLHTTTDRKVLVFKSPRLRALFQRPRHAKRDLKKSGFTIVELLIVVVVIGILAAIVIVAYNGVQARARDARRLADIQTVNKALQLYYIDNGSYPITAPSGMSTAYTDTNCQLGTKQADWVPGLTPKYLPQLPQSFSPRPWDSRTGCYQYASDGTSYVLGAWQALETGPQSTTLYRRLGFREGWAAAGNGGVQAYYCANGSSPAYWDAYYKYSYTVSNVTTCNES
jgi:type II secretion system protein G